MKTKTMYLFAGICLVISGLLLTLATKNWGMIGLCASGVPFIVLALSDEDENEDKK